MLYWKQDFQLSVLPKYGDLVMYNLGPLTFCKINDAQVATKVLQVIKDRPDFFAGLMDSLHVAPGLSLVNDDRQWTFRRRKMMHGLLEVLNAKQFEENFSKVSKNLTYRYLDSKLCENGLEYIWHPKDCVFSLTTNSIYLALFGKTLDTESEEYKDLVHGVVSVAEDGGPAYLKTVLPDFIGDSLFGKQYKRFCAYSKRVYSIVGQEYQEIKQNISNDSNNLLTLAEYYAKEGKISENIKIADLWIAILASVDTSAHTVQVGLALIAHHQHIQNQVYNEVRAHASDGEDVAFHLSDVKHCPLLKAFVHEALRIAVTVPNALTRISNHDVRCMKLKDDTVLCDVIGSDIWKKYGDKLDKSEKSEIVYDYIIPKHCFIEPNTYYMAINDRIWNLDKNPRKMNLNYWLKTDVNGNVKFVLNKNSMPFGTGARECPGRQLGVKQLYAFFTNLLLKYRVDCKGFENNQDDGVSLVANIGDMVSTFTQPVKVRITKRV